MKTIVARFECFYVRNTFVFTNYKLIVSQQSRLQIVKEIMISLRKRSSFFFSSTECDDRLVFFFFSSFLTLARSSLKSRRSTRIFSSILSDFDEWEQFLRSWDDSSRFTLESQRRKKRRMKNEEKVLDELFTKVLRIDEFVTSEWANELVMSWRMNFSWVVF
jgi:hypothetical protein